MESRAATLKPAVSLRKLFARNGILVAPGAYDAFTARLIQETGFEAVYLSGAGISFSSLGQPDVGLVTMTEMVERAASICAAVNLPVIADGDNGYGNAINVQRTVREYERAGVAAIQLEDQTFPKRCGHLAGKEVISAEEMVGKIRAAIAARADSNFMIIARTDAREDEGLDAALKRGEHYLRAGADILFVEAPESEHELRRIGEIFRGAILMANMVEGGKTPLISASELESFGFKLVIFPNSLTRLFARAGLELLRTLYRNGTTRPMLDQMLSFQEINKMLGIEHFRELEQEFLPRANEKR